MHKTMRKSLKKGKSKVNPYEAGPSVVENSMESNQVVLEPRRSFWKSLSNIFKCTTKRRHTLEADETEQANILPVHQNLQPITEESKAANDTDSVREDIEDMKTILKKYSISPNSVSMVQRIELNAASKNISKSSLTGYLTDVSSSSSEDDEETARKKVLLKNKINEYKQEIIREETKMQMEKVPEEEMTMKKADDAGVVNDDVSSLTSTLTMDNHSFDYSESSQQSIVDGNEEKPEKVMFDNNIIVKDENDIVTVDSINDASQQIRDMGQNTDENPVSSLNKLKHEDNVAMIEEQYKIALSTVNKIEEEITAYSIQLENMNSKSNDSTPQSLELENRDATQNAMKIFGTKIMDNQGSYLLRHLHDMHRKHAENKASVDDSLAKTKAMNKQMDTANRCKFGYEFPYYPPGNRSTRDDNDEDTMSSVEETQDYCSQASSSESLNEVEVWSKDLDNVYKYRDRRDVSICRLFDSCPVNEDGYKALRLNNLFTAVADPVSLQCSVVYDPLHSQNVLGQHHRLPQHVNEDNLVTHKQKYMSLVEHEQTDEEESLDSFNKQINDRCEENWETWTCETESLHEDHEVNETESLDQNDEVNETDNDEDSDWKTVDNEESDVDSMSTTEYSHEEYVNQQNRYNLMSTLPPASSYSAKPSNPPLEFKVSMRCRHRENFVREYVAYRNVKKVDKSTSYSSLPAAAATTMELLYKNQDAQSEVSTSCTEDKSIVFRNINDDVQHMINDLLIDMSEVKDECCQYTDEMSDEPPMVEFKQTTCDGVTRYIDTDARINEALAQTILHEILEDVFYYSEEHYSEPGTNDNDEYACDMSDNVMPETELHDHDKREDTFEEENYTYMRKDDRSKVFKNLDEVMYDIMRDMPDDPPEDCSETTNAKTDEESCEFCTCPPSIAEMNIQRKINNKIQIIQTRSILRDMFKNEENKRRTRKAHVAEPDTNYMCNEHNFQCNHTYTGNVPKYTSTGSVLNERKEILTDSNPGCNYHNFFNNNFSIKSGIIRTPDILDNSTLHTCSKAENCQSSEQQGHSRTLKCKNNLVTNKCIGNEYETTLPMSSKPDNLLNKNELEQNIQENLNSFEDTMKKLIQVNRKTAQILKSTCGLFPTVENTVENSVEKPCCSNKHTESGKKITQNLSETIIDSSEHVTKNVTELNKSLTKTDPSFMESGQNLTMTDQSFGERDQNLTENLKNILSKFTQQFSECVQEKSNLK